MTPPSRLSCLLAGAWCIVLALVYTNLLVVNPQDNAYLWVMTTGQMMFVVGMAWVCAAIIYRRNTPRTLVWWVALGLLWLVGVLGGGLLLLALAIIPSQGYADAGVLWVHVVALLGLAASVYGLTFRLPRNVFE